ncbi:hypothetical protein SLS60_005983 [Paraconiothyrium brasiliense]|uniref:Uncharacterized protein n=1 Tax=Paraconiothyrium brasiliense TaxID=300254 RepID=A0ABR3RDY8_9PLEO
MSSDNTKTPSAEAPSTPDKTYKTTKPQFTPPPYKAPSVDDLAEHLADTRVDHPKNGPMDDLAGAFGHKWSPNHTFEEKGQERQNFHGALPFRPRGKEDDGSARK